MKATGVRTRVVAFFTARNLSKAQAQSRNSFLEGAAVLAGFAVFAGLVAESFVLLANHAWIEDFGINESAMEAIDIVGTLVVTFGVFLEFVTHWAHIFATRRIEGFSEAELGEQTERIAHLNLRAEQEATKRAEIEAKIAPRGFTDEECEAIKKRLLPYSETRVGVIIAGAPSAEIEGFAKHVWYVMAMSGWHVMGVAYRRGFHFEGMSVELDRGLASDRDAHAAQELLEALGSYETVFRVLMGPGADFEGNAEVVERIRSAPVRVNIGEKLFGPPSYATWSNESAE